MDDRLTERAAASGGMVDRHAMTRARRAVDERLAAGVAHAAIESGDFDDPGELDAVVDAVLPGLMVDLVPIGEL